MPGRARRSTDDPQSVRTHYVPRMLRAALHRACGSLRRPSHKQEACEVLQPLNTSFYFEANVQSISQGASKVEYGSLSVAADSRVLYQYNL